MFALSVSVVTVPTPPLTSPVPLTWARLNVPLPNGKLVTKYFRD
jgi:hypothetical protein